MRWSGTLATILLIGTVLLAADEKARTFKFAKADAGKVPGGWKVDKTGKEKGSEWKIVADESAPSKSGYVLAQVAQSPTAVFNLCVAEDTSYKDVEISVAFKAVKGAIDQGGGIVWRYQDANNYYIARLNPLEDNYRVYKVIDGKREQLDNEKDLKVKAGEWHTLRIEHRGNQIACFLDNNKVLTAEDNAISKAGKIGLWTKADAQTYFDDLKVIDRAK